VDRRTLIKTGGMAAIGLGVSACASRRPARLTTTRRVNLPPVHIAWDRIIRTTVGLRPHRPSGFVVRVAKLDEKVIVHNYGHGGAGMSLSWGTGYQAADLAMDHGDRRVAVIGSGVVGLTAARQLQRRGFTVTIYAMAVPPDTTSNLSLAGFTPMSGLIDRDKHTPEWDAQFRRAADISYRQLQLLVGAHYGVSWVDQYGPTDAVQPPNANAPSPSTASLLVGPVILQPGEHPFPQQYASKRPILRIEPSIYLDALMRDFMMFGGRLVIRKFDTPGDLMSIDEALMINCTGLGSRALFGDEELTPLKGQLTVLVPQPEIFYSTNGGARNTGGGFVHMMPRADGIVLGGTSQRGIWTLEPDEEERKRVVDTHIALFAGMHPPAPGEHVPAPVIPDATPSLASHFDLES
jgi:D-amino-acid oxidase